MPANALTLTTPVPPKVGHSLMELSRIFLEAGSMLALNPLLRRFPKGDGHTVMTLPGFFGADGSTASLRKYLNKQGYQAVPWGLGRNVPDEGMTGMEQAMAFRREMEGILADLIAKEVKRSGGRVSLVGWSLGGLYSTGLAHRYPDLIRQVVTLGTPFGDPRGTALYPVLQRMYQGVVNDESLAEWVGFTFEGKLEVPVTALYSLTDGIVGSEIALLPEHSLMENIAVMASHVGFPFNPLVRGVLAERLAQDEGDWQPYSAPNLRPFVHQPA